MQFKVATITTMLALVSVAAANPAHHNRASQISARHDQCQSGGSYCCRTIAMKDDNTIGHILNDVGDIVDTLLGSLNGLVGWYCNPIDLLGITQTACKSHAVCCSDVHLSGLVVAGCNPINIG